jgi:hypothetical protein
MLPHYQYPLETVSPSDGDFTGLNYAVASLWIRGRWYSYSCWVFPRRLNF